MREMFLPKRQAHKFFPNKERKKNQSTRLRICCP